MNLNFNSSKGYTLQDDHALLRPLTAADINHLLPFAINEPETWLYSHRSAKGEEGMKTYITEALTAKADGREYPFIVFDKRTGEYAGSTRFYDIQPHWQTLQLGYTWYGQQFRGTGLNKHCKFLLLQLAFEEFHAERVEFRADARNQRSITAMKNIGCIPEGLLRSTLPLEDGGRRDTIILSILKNEWFQSVKQNLRNKL